MSQLRGLAERLGFAGRSDRQAETAEAAGQRDYRTVTVTSVDSATDGEGGAAIILGTSEIGPIAFAIDLPRAEALRDEVAAILERLRNPEPGPDGA